MPKRRKSKERWKYTPVSAVASPTAAETYTRVRNINVVDYLETERDRNTVRLLHVRPIVCRGGRYRLISDQRETTKWIPELSSETWYKAPFTRYNLLSNPLSNRLYNRLYRVNGV